MNDIANGMAVVARLLSTDSSRPAGEYIVHGAWSPVGWIKCLARGRGRYTRMPHGSFSPVYLIGQSRWKKKLAAPFERYFLRRAEKIIVTCEAEKEWTVKFLGLADSDALPPVEVVDLRKYWKLAGRGRPKKNGGAKSAERLHVLYLGRRHPLKGVQYLEEACGRYDGCELKVVTDAAGEEKEAAFSWADILVLPTLSENFGIVVAEALERSIPVLTTDGAPAWRGTPGIICLEGFCSASGEERVAMLLDAITRFSSDASL